MNAPISSNVRQYYTPALYKAYVRKMKDRYEAEAQYGSPLDSLEFVATCLRMTMDEAREAHSQSPFKAHYEVANSILTTQKKEFVSPIIICTAVLEQNGTPRYRTGDVGPAGGSPPARHCKQLLSFWEKIVRDGIQRMQHASSLERWIFTMQMYDSFHCLQPFSEGNWRTNWFQLQTIRRAVDLPHIMLRYEDAEERDERIDVYRWVYFVPWMKDHAYM